MTLFTPRERLAIGASIAAVIGGVFMLGATCGVLIWDWVRKG